MDVASIAARHPAWQLAQRLEGSSDLKPLSLQSPRASLTAVPDWQAAFGRNETVGRPQWPDQSTLGLDPAFTSTASYSGGFSANQSSASSSRGLLLAMGLPDLQTRMRERQLNALDSFAGSTEQTQQELRDADLQARLAAMQEDIEHAREVNLAAVNPLLPSDPIQLEMTNLRLQLQVLEVPGNVYATPSAIAAARARLSELNADWRRALRGQESERRELLARLRDERPRRIELQRRREIEIAQRADKERDDSVRQQVAGEARRRISEDFETADARLGIVFPVADKNGLESRLSFRTRGEQRASATPRNSKTSRTAALAASDIALFPPQIESVDELGFAASMQDWVRLSPSQRQAQIRRLRALAWSDARQWARVATLRNAALQRSLRQSAPAKLPMKPQ